MNGNNQRMTAVSSRRRSLLIGFSLLAVLSGCAGGEVEVQVPDRYMLFFTRNSAVVRVDEPVIEALVRDAERKKDDRVVVVGFADPNETIGMDRVRAEAVTNRLIQLGIEAKRIDRAAGGTEAAVKVGDSVIREGSYRVEIYYQPL